MLSPTEHEATKTQGSMRADVQAVARSSNHRKGLLITAVGGTIFTFDIPLARLAMTDQWTLTCVRGLFLAVAIAVLWTVFRRINGIRTPFINGWAGIIVAITNTIANILFFCALTRTPAANLVFILALNPVFSLILAWIFLSERTPLWTWIAVALALFGVSIIVWDGLIVGTYIGDLLAVGVALCTATALTVIRKSGKDVVTSLAVGSLVSAGFALFWGAQPGNLSLQGWSWLALNGLLVMPLASGLIAFGPRYLPAPEVALFFLLEVVLVPIWMWLIFDELPTVPALIGGTIVFTALFAHGTWRYVGSKQAKENKLFDSC